MKPTKEEFHAYQDVQRSGVTNMYDTVAVQTLSDKYYDVWLSNEVIKYIMANYKSLVEEYGNVER